MILLLQLPAEGAAGAGALPRRLLPRAARRRARRPLVDEFYQRRHHVGQWGNAFGTLTTSVDAEAAGGVHDARRRRADVLGRDAGLGRPAGLGLRARCRCRSSRCRISSAASWASGCWSVAWGLARRLDAAYVLGVGGLVVGHRRVVAERGRLRGGAACWPRCSWCSWRAAMSSTARPRSSTFLSPADGSSRRSRGGGRVGLASGCSRSGTSSTRSDLWWRFEVDQDAPRFLRATVGVPSRCAFVGHATADAAARRMSRASRPTRS